MIKIRERDKPALRPDSMTIYYGHSAIAAVSQSLGRCLTYAECRVIEEEGFVDGDYWDTKGILTSGVGQTGKWRDKSFDETFQAHADRARSRLPDFDDYSELLQAELIQSEYRGDLGQSPTAMRLLREGKHEASADEFLNNREYLNPETSTGIKARMRATSDAIREHRLA